MSISNNFRNSLLTIWLLVILFIVLDILLARMLIQPSNRSFRTAHYYYHHGLIPNQKAIAEWYNIRYSMFTNSMGFRDAQPREIALQTHKKRILLLGDSHSEGVGLRFEDTFAGQLIAMTDTSKTEILNASVVSYSPRIHYLKMKYLIEVVGLEIDELIVFIDLSDLQNEIAYEGFEPKLPSRLGKAWFQMSNTLVNRSFTLYTLRNIRQARETNRFIRKSEIFDEYRKDESHINALELYATFFSEFDDKTLLSNPAFHGVGVWIYDDVFVKLAQKGLEIGGQNMAKLAELCRENNISLTISVHPWPEQIQLRQETDLYVDFWKDFAEEHQTGFINLYPIFINPPVSASLGMEFFIPGDNHWNKNGNFLVASELSKYLNNKSSNH